MSARVGVVVFPGTNCELDVVYAVEHLGGRAEPPAANENVDEFRK